MKIDKKAVGSRIKQIRTNKGYTLEAFGKVINASKSSISEWEKGNYLPTKERLYNISKIANLTIDELFFGENKKGIQDLYEQIIKLSKDDATTLINKVNEYFGGERQCK